MDPIARAAEDVLVNHPHPALRLGEVVELIARRVDARLDGTRLRLALEAHPDRFRIVEGWRVRWTTLHVRGSEDPASEAWVVALAPPGPPCPPGAPGARPTPSDDEPRQAGPVSTPVRSLRESVRWVGLGVDGRSTLDVGRWYAVVMAERAVRHALARGARAGPIDPSAA